MSLSERVEYLFQRWRIRACLLLGCRQMALRMVVPLLQRFPGDIYALTTQAHLQSELGDDAGAIATLERAVHLQDVQASTWFNLGYLREKEGRPARAEEAFRRSIALDPQLDRAWYGLGLSLIRQRRFDEAVDALRQCTELQPMSPYGWYQLARVHVDRQEPEMAARIIGHLRRFEPKIAAQLERETGLGQAQA